MEKFGANTAGRVFAATAAVVLIMALCLLPQPVHAASNFIIEDYAIKVVVHEDDTYEVTESLIVHFTLPSHGIYRTIPLRTTLDRDGQRSTFYAKVKDFTMVSGQHWEDESNRTNFSARIGDPALFANTDTVYMMRYTYDMREDHFQGGDEVYFNLVGTSWEAQSIEHVSFDVQFPKPIDMSKVGIKTGNAEYIPFEAVSDTRLKGETDKYVLGGLTIRAVLPEGYFTRQEGTGVIPLLGISALMILLAAAGFVLWRKYGRDPQVIETEEFYPPENLSAPEVGYLSEGEIRSNHIISSLLSLADRGYLKISETEKPAKKKKKKPKMTYEITKLREYEEDVIGERAFMDGLFADGDTIGIEDLENKFYKTVNAIKRDIVSHYEGRLYDTKARKIAKIMKAGGVIGILLILTVCAFKGSGLGEFNFDSSMRYLYYFAVTTALLIVGFSGITKKINERSHYGWIIGYGVCILIALAFSIFVEIAPGVRFIPFLIGIGMCFVLFFMSALCERKTEWYAEILGRIKGYTNFLEIAEKDKMEALAEEDPGYFYKNLAFAFALGVTSVYAEHFASMATQPPDWYAPSITHSGSVTGAESATSFLGSVNSMMGSISGSMTSSPSSGGGGGSFSGGGGGGGGGGGSW